MTVINMDCRLGMSTMPDNFFDSIVTDPPYGLSKQPNIQEVLKHWLAGDDYAATGGGFMGKSWDSFVPGPLTWKEAYRVLKPGGFIACFAGSRTVDLMSMSLRLGGFEVVDMAHWLYGSGFPKSLDISKAIDKLNGRPAHPDDGFRGYLRSALSAKGLKISDLDKLCGTNGMAGHWTGKSQPEFPTAEKWALIKTLLQLDGRYDEIIARVEAQRKVVGQKTSGIANKTEGRRGLLGAAVSVQVDITEAHTEEAKQWEGWGTALKPCHEPIIIARKPLDGTYANNVLTHGVGGMNIDGCRVGTEEMQRTASNGQKVSENAAMSGGNSPVVAAGSAQGRWPGNVMHDGCLPEPMDRYFYCAKASSKDREAGLELMKLQSTASVTERDADSAGHNNPRAGTRGADRANIHPTVKPTELMCWLCRLITPPGGTVLDPFTGSGSTGRGAVLEGFEFVGFELGADYAEIARARIEDAKS